MTEPVGYTFSADTWHTDCLAELFTLCDSRLYGARETMADERILDKVAEFRGIDRNDETSYDSEVFPKAVFYYDADGLRCGRCGKEL